VDFDDDDDDGCVREHERRHLKEVSNVSDDESKRRLSQKIYDTQTTKIIISLNHAMEEISDFTSFLV
jgi:hypothetical protein